MVFITFPNTEKTHEILGNWNAIRHFLAKSKRKLTRKRKTKPVKICASQGLHLVI